jgi:hypothetical protein
MPKRIEYSALGVVISEDELVYMVQGDHIHGELRPFQTRLTKQFDKQQLISSNLQNLAQKPLPTPKMIVPFQKATLILRTSLSYFNFTFQELPATLATQNGLKKGW